jgi:hypothetical protein
LFQREKTAVEDTAPFVVFREFMPSEQVNRWISS